uniref:60S acidic ribosomal protein P1-like n=1 Tax=Myodes glareolus TaxID=447135 RepID=UPI0020207058|nr:60S acidic ribosomal protein P1-like [Myodes glareolus]
MASFSELPCIYSALILHNDEVTALNNVNTGSLICNVGTGGPDPAAGVAPAVEAKKEESESEESNDDMGFGLFD